MVIITVLLFSLTIVISGLIYMVQSFSKHSKIYLIDWTFITIVFLYGFGFPLVYLTTLKGENSSPYSQFILQYTTPEIIYYFILIMLLMLSLGFGWHLSIKKNRKNVTSKIESSQRAFYKKRYVKKHISFAWFMLFFSVISFYIYSIAYGGFIGLLSFTISIRSGVEKISNSFSFLQIFGQLALTSTYVFYSIYIDRSINNENKKGSFIGFICSMLFSIFYLYSLGGRLPMISFFFTLILTTTYYHSKKVTIFIKKISKKIIWLPIIFITMDILWDRTNENSLLSLLVSTISYPFAAFMVNFKEGNYRFFKDFLQAPLYFLPSSFWSEFLNITTANNETTYLISGAYKGENIGGRIVTSTTPNDIISFSYMQFNLLGIIVVGIFLGISLKIIHQKINRTKLKGYKSMLYSYFAINVATRMIFSGDISLVITGNWGFIVYLLVFSVYKKIIFRKSHYIMQ